MSLYDEFEKLMNQETLFKDRNDGRMLINEETEEFITSEELEQLTGPQEETVVENPQPEQNHFKRFNKKHTHKYTEQEMSQINESVKTTYVHDYGKTDRYHLSDEERAKRDSLNELRVKLNGLKTVYRQVDKYILAMRVVVEAWEILEKKDNYIHTEDEFFKLVSQGKIYSPSIPMPKLVHADRYNTDVLIKYISNPELDPEDLLPVKNNDDSWYDQFKDDETEAEEMERLLSPEEVQYVLDHVDNPDTIKVHDIKQKYIQGYDRKRLFGQSTKKRKFSKKEKYMVDNLHAMLNQIQSNPANRNSSIYSRTFLVTSSMFEPEKPDKDPFDDIKFDGSWTNEDDLFLYDLAIEEERLKQHPSNDSYLSYGDKELQDFFRIMEQNGMNTVDLRRKMNMSTEQLNTRDRDREKKRNKKTEAELLQRIIKLNESDKFKKLIKKAEKKNSQIE